MSVSDGVVYQSIHREATSEGDPHKWVMAAVSDEVPKVRNLIAKGTTRYVLVTNVRGPGDVTDVDRSI